MTEQSFIIRSAKERTLAAQAVLNIQGIEPLMEVIVRPKIKLRSDAQNKKYWTDLGRELGFLAQEVESISQHTGYTPLEVRRLIAKELEPEQAAILFTLSQEAAHEVLKLINGIPTSTRLGTKQFAEFEDRMVQTVAEIVGQVRAFGERAQ